MMETAIGLVEMNYYLRKRKDQTGNRNLRDLHSERITTDE